MVLHHHKLESCTKGSDALFSIRSKWAFKSSVFTSQLQISVNTQSKCNQVHGGHRGTFHQGPLRAPKLCKFTGEKSECEANDFVREAEQIIVNYKMEQDAAVKWRSQALAGCARREMLSRPVMTTTADILAILKETFDDQWGLSALLTAFHSWRHGICKHVLEYTQSLVMLSTKLNEAKAGTMNDRCSRTISLMDYAPHLYTTTFDNLWEIVIVLHSNRCTLKHFAGCTKTVR